MSLTFAKRVGPPRVRVDCPQGRCDARARPVSTVVVPDQWAHLRKQAARVVRAVRHVSGAVARPVLLQRTETGNETIVIVRGQVLAPDQQEVVLHEQAPEFDLDIRREGLRDVDTDDLRTESGRQRNDVHPVTVALSPKREQGYPCMSE